MKMILLSNLEKTNYYSTIILCKRVLNLAATELQSFFFILFNI